mgnify:CR=1 FL=1
MALTIQQVETIIDNLEIALSTGATTVSIDGRTMAYKNTKEMIRALEYFKNKLAALNGEQPYRSTMRSVSFN